MGLLMTMPMAPLDEWAQMKITVCAKRSSAMPGMAISSLPSRKLSPCSTRASFLPGSGSRPISTRVSFSSMNAG